MGGSEEVWTYRDCADWSDYERIHLKNDPSPYDQFGEPDPVKEYPNTALSYLSDDSDDEYISDGTETFLPKSGLAAFLPKLAFAEPPPQPTARVKSKSKAREVRPGPTKPPRRHRYEYDVAVSFAGEQRAFVQQVVDEMKAKDIRVFYDYDERHELWGKDLISHLDKVYRKKALYCIVFASADYKRKHWTKHERQSAQNREFKQRGEYILPVRMDDADIPGLLDTKGYIDARSGTPKLIAETLLLKLKGKLVR